MHNSFDSKWAKIKSNPQTDEEASVFVERGATPKTQRQLNLYNYFLFIKNVLEKANARSVLEIGCGRGTLGLYLAEYLGKEISLLDSAPNAIEVAKEQFRAHKQEASYYVRDALNSGLPEESFDAVISIGLAEHFNGDGVENLFREQHRLLKKGGVMVSLNIPQKFSAQILNIAMRKIKKTLGFYNGNVRRDYYRNDYAPEEYKHAARIVGFQNIFFIHVAPFPLFVPVSNATDRKITTLYKAVLTARGWFQKYPYKTNRFFSLAHFLVGYKR